MGRQDCFYTPPRTQNNNKNDVVQPNLPRKTAKFKRRYIFGGEKALVIHRQALDISRAGSNHPARSARQKFEAPSGGDCYPDEKRQNKAFLFGR